MTHDRDVPHPVEPRRVSGHNEHARPQIGGRFRIGHSHDDGEFRAIGARCVPLLAVDHIRIPVLYCRGFQHNRVRPWHIHLGHGKAAPDLALHQRPQVSLLLILCSMQVEDFDVTSIRGLTTKNIVAQGRSA